MAKQRKYLAVQRLDIFIDENMAIKYQTGIFKYQIIAAILVVAYFSGKNTSAIMHLALPPP